MRNINIACGEWNVLPDWENYDIDRALTSKGVKYLDILEKLPWADMSVDFILIEHCLEHHECGQDLKFMEEARRVLKPGGILRVIVPDPTHAALSYQARWSMLCEHGHKMCFCPENLRMMLYMARFSLVRQTERKECDGHSRNPLVSPEADNLESLRMEGVK